MTATARQIDTITNMARERGMDAHSARQMAAKLSKTDASYVIGSLKRQPKVKAQPTIRRESCPDGCCWVEYDAAGNAIGAC